MFESTHFLKYEDKELMLNKSIKKELLKYYNNYSNNYIENIINNLYETNILPTNNSIIGWNLFVRDFIISKINNTIKMNTAQVKKRVKLVYIDSLLNFTDYDIIQKICYLL